jgi:hypothetical protein
LCGVNIPEELFIQFQNHYNNLWNKLGGAVGKKMKGIQGSKFERPVSPLPGLVYGNNPATEGVMQGNVGFSATTVIGGTIFWKHK